MYLINFGSDHSKVELIWITKHRCSLELIVFFLISKQLILRFNTLNWVEFVTHMRTNSHYVAWSLDGDIWPYVEIFSVINPSDMNLSDTIKSRIDAVMTT